jgi:hypothetical protein
MTAGSFAATFEAPTASAFSLLHPSDFIRIRVDLGRSRVGNDLSGHKLHAVEIPIACTLEQGDARSQLGEWHEVLHRVVDGSERVSPGRLELSLLPDADLGSVISLAQREAACCAFFSFAIEIRADRLVFIIEVPNDAVEILNQLVSRRSA